MAFYLSISIICCILQIAMMYSTQPKFNDMDLLPVNNMICLELCQYAWQQIMSFLKVYNSILGQSSRAIRVEKRR